MITMLLWFAVAIQSLLALVLAVVALIMSIKTNTIFKDDQLQRQFDLEDAKQMFEINKLSTAKPKGINLPPVQASGHVLFLQSDVNDGPSFTNDHPVRIKLNVESYHRGVTVSEDGITIQYSGIYFIYSSVNFKLTTANCSELSYQEWFHYIIKQNLIEDFKTTLLKSAYTCCEECSQIEETKYIAGQFYLESGDLITAMSSGQNLIGGSQESSFLGLVMLISGHRTATVQLINCVRLFESGASYPKPEAVLHTFEKSKESYSFSSVEIFEYLKNILNELQVLLHEKRLLRPLPKPWDRRCGRV